MTSSSRTLFVCALAASLVACGGDDDESPEPSHEHVDILDPASDHYGKSYAEWTQDWTQWISDVAPPECANPILDTTGENCAMYQDPDSPVFLLAGNFGGVSLRDQCVVPEGKALFFPIVNVFADNAGIPEDMLLTDEALRAFVEDQYTHVVTDSLHLSVDGEAIDHLERGGIESAPYTIELAPGANIYDCNEVEGVEGEFDGYSSGYWAMLAPLEPGAHTVSFGGTAEAAPQGDDINIDVTFELTVE